MKLIATAAALCLSAFLTGCASDHSTTAAPGAMGDSKASCKEGAGAACCKEGQMKEKAAPGAVNGATTGGCCKDGKDGKAAGTCPFSGSGTGTKSDGTSPGAVSGTKTGCGAGACKNAK